MEGIRYVAFPDPRQRATIRILSTATEEILLRGQVTLETTVGSFVVGSLLALTSAGWVLADNTDREKVAVAVVDQVAPLYRVRTSRGELVRVPSHGLGSTGQKLWLGTSGAMVDSEPAGSSVEVVQEVAKVVDSDQLYMFPNTPPTF